MEARIVIPSHLARESLEFVQPGASLRTIAYTYLKHENLLRQLPLRAQVIEYLAQAADGGRHKIGVAGVGNASRQAGLVALLKSRLPPVEGLPVERIERPDDAGTRGLKR